HLWRDRRPVGERRHLRRLAAAGELPLDLRRQPVRPPRPLLLRQLAQQLAEAVGVGPAGALDGEARRVHLLRPCGASGPWRRPPWVPRPSPADTAPASPRARPGRTGASAPPASAARRRSGLPRPRATPATPPPAGSAPAASRGCSSASARRAPRRRTATPA